MSVVSKFQGKLASPSAVPTGYFGYNVVSEEITITIQTPDQIKNTSYLVLVLDAKVYSVGNFLGGIISPLSGTPPYVTLSHLYPIAVGNGINGVKGTTPMNTTDIQGLVLNHPYALLFFNTVGDAYDFLLL